MRWLSFSFLPLFGFSFAPTAIFPTRRTSCELFAKDGPPKYEKIEGFLREAEKVGKGTVMLHVEVNEDENIDYKPGHVIALEMEDKDGVCKTSFENDGWMRGPYTISRSNETYFDVLIKEVGAKSRAFASSRQGTPVRFGGKFHVPILEGIKEKDVKRVVMISTGVGVGPCVGAIELALEKDAFPPIELYASFREAEEVVYNDYLNGLCKKHARQFSWQPIITSEVGRLSKGTNLRTVFRAGFGIADTHFHLIGNGQMVKEWKSGLEKAGVPDNKVTIEQYFNHKASVDSEVVKDISSSCASSCAVLQ